MRANKGSLGPQENMSLLQNQMEEALRQAPIVSRLRLFGVQSDLIATATSFPTGSPEYEAAENAIISHVSKTRLIDEEEAILLISGKKTCTF